MSKRDPSTPKSIPLAGVDENVKNEHVYITPRSFLAPVGPPPRSFASRLKDATDHVRNLDAADTFQFVKRAVKQEVMNDEIRSKRLGQAPTVPDASEEKENVNLTTPPPPVPATRGARHVVNNLIKDQIRFPKAIIQQSEATLRTAKIGALARRPREHLLCPSARASPAISDPTASALRQRHPGDGSPEDATQASPRPFTAPGSVLRMPGSAGNVYGDIRLGAPHLESVRRNLQDLPEGAPLSVPAPARPTHLRVDVRNPSPTPEGSHPLLSPSPSYAMKANYPLRSTSRTPGKGSMPSLPPSNFTLKSPVAAFQSSSSKTLLSGPRRFANLKAGKAVSAPPPDLPSSSSSRAVASGVTPPPNAQKYVTHGRRKAVRFGSEEPPQRHPEPKTGGGTGSGSSGLDVTFATVPLSWSDLPSPSKQLQQVGDERRLRLGLRAAAAEGRKVQR